jgi:6-phosphogluconate dehydrogenase
MVHNGIEYGMMQAYGEGFEIIKNSDYNVDLARLSQVWNHGSVVRSWLLELAELAFQQEGSGLDEIRGYVEDSGEGRWTVLEAINQSVPAPVITLSLMARFVSRQQESFSAQVAAALRNQFGGHAVRVSEAIESMVAAETMRSIAPGSPSIPATTVTPTTEQAAEDLMTRVQQAEEAAETVPDPAKVVKSIQGTAQEVYQPSIEEGTDPDQ